VGALRGTKVMRALTFMVGAAIGMVEFSVGNPRANADPAYSSNKVIQFFENVRKQRTVCLGTAADCKEKEAAEAPRFDLLVNFAFDSDRLAPAAKENLDQFAEALKDPRLKSKKFEIDGHTDSVGTENYNQGLSERRAAAVVSYLTSRGLDPSLLTAKGFGQTKPRVLDPYSPENRRVETHLSE
jgi:outer membrane protein OmpA-like peptidoglycan-associated protein